MGENIKGVQEFISGRRHTLTLLPVVLFATLYNLEISILCSDLFFFSDGHLSCLVAAFQSPFSLHRRCPLLSSLALALIQFIAAAGYLPSQVPKIPSDSPKWGNTHVRMEEPTDNMPHEPGILNFYDIYLSFTMAIVTGQLTSLSLGYRVVIDNAP